MEINIDSLVRKNILNLKPYSSARNEFTGEASIFIDANENPFENNYNRYPDPLQKDVKNKIGRIKNIDPETIFLGNGSDEAIDLLYRIFCNPGVDNVVAPDPTYGMYQVCAEINDIEYRSIKLNDDYSLDIDALKQSVDNNTKILFICSPNNPTGNLINGDQILELLKFFKGILVIDEAYIDFATEKSFIYSLDKYPNLVVLQTFSKAWGQASIRLGMAFASKQIISYFNKVKYPYNINILTQRHALEMLENEDLVKQQTEQILLGRKYLEENLIKIPIVENLYPSDANFILAKVTDADKIYHYLTQKGIIVRNRNKVTLCQNCLRLTIGTQKENKLLVEALKTYNS